MNTSDQLPSDSEKPDDELVSESASTDEDSESQTETGNEEDDFPEWEPLTPELVEDEAIRGDFVIRWAVILLALLLGCTAISESTTLVHIKSGEYLVQNGILPPSTDVFSFTANDRSWVNLSWLFDLATAGVYAIGGFVGLSIFKAILAAVVVGVLANISKPDLPTWWGSVCAGIALLVWYPHFTMRPELITLLGLSVTLWFLSRWRDTGDSKSLWMLVPVFFLWSNLDPRMFLGLVLLLLFAVGRACGSVLGHSTPEQKSSHTHLWKVVGVCFAVAMLNPFGWNSLLAPFTLYGIEYPVLRERILSIRSFNELQQLSMFSEQIWDTLDPLLVIGDHRIVSGLVMLLITAITFILNWDRVDFGLFLAFLGFFGIFLAGIHELAATTVVCCVISTLNAQEWYQDNFQQNYTTNFSELLFSRGGRAITVLGFFCLAYLTISGRLDGPNGRRTGVGLDAVLQTGVEGLTNDLADSYDNQPFNFRLDQGDLLIWAGQRVFIDSRISLYSGTGENDLIQLHDTTRRALRLQAETQQSLAQTKVWKQTFDRFRITHAVPRLSYPNPDYQTYLSLLVSPDWQLNRLGASAAVFYRTDLSDAQNQNHDPELKTYIADHKADFNQDAFGEEASQSNSREIWPHAPSVYEKYLALPKTAATENLWQAGHYARHIDYVRLGQMPFTGDTLAYAYLAIRKANQVLEEDPQNAEAFRILGGIYDTLEHIEIKYAQNTGGAFSSQRRFYQAVQAFSQALIIKPNDLQTLRSLASLYYRHRKLDVCMDLIDRVNVITDQLVGELADVEIDQQRSENQLRKQIFEQLESAYQQFESEKENKTPLLQIANVAMQSGYPLYALKTLDEDSSQMAGDPRVQIFRMLILMEIGKVEEAVEAMDRLEGVVEQIPDLDWKSQAAFASLANTQYVKAAGLWQSEAQTWQERKSEMLLNSLPFVAPAPTSFGGNPDLWLIKQTRESSFALIQTPAMIAAFQFEGALCHLERGDNQAAENLFRELLKTSSETPLQSLAKLYLQSITGETFDPGPASDQIPVTSDMFTDEKKQQDQPERKSPAPENQKQD